MQQRTRTKICGITRSEDARAAADAGVDCIGMVFVAASKRKVTAQTACSIRCSLPPFVSVAALFMDADATTVSNVISALQPDMLQFHGSESADFCRQFGRPYLKSIATAGGADLDAASRTYADACGLLVDGHGSGEMGGSGRRVATASLSGRSRLPLVLAGGLTPDNVAAAIRDLRPWAVDVSSGVESAPGEKDPALMHAFLNEVRKADEQLSVS